MHAVLPLTDAEDIDQNAVLFLSREHKGGNKDNNDSEDEYPYDLPYNPFEAIFLHWVVLDVDVPQMAWNDHAPSLSFSAFKYFFGATEEEVCYKFNLVSILSWGVPSTHRVITNKTKCMPHFIPLNNRPLDNLFELASKGYALPPPPVDDGSNMEVEDSGETTGIDKKITQLYW